MLKVYFEVKVLTKTIISILRTAIVPRPKQLYPTQQNLHLPPSPADSTSWPVPSEGQWNNNSLASKELKTGDKDRLTVEESIIVTKAQLQTIKRTIVNKEQNLTFVPWEDNFNEIEIVRSTDFWDKRQRRENKTKKRYRTIKKSILDAVETQVGSD